MLLGTWNEIARKLNATKSDISNQFLSPSRAAIYPPMGAAIKPLNVLVLDMNEANANSIPLMS